MTIGQWKEKGSYFDYNGQKIFTVEEGSGDYLLLIHGFPTASWDWWKMWDVLATRYSIIALDMIGFGYSDKPKQYAYSIFDQADIIESLLTDRNISRVHILSHDYGDTVAQELLARHQDRKNIGKEGLRIESLCLLNGGLFPETHHPLLIQKMLMSPLGSLIGRMMSKKKLHKNFDEIFGHKTKPTDSEIDSFWNLMMYNDGRAVFHKLIWYMKDRQENRDRWVPALQKVQLPLRLINGVQDPISGQHMVDRYREIIPNPDVVELKGIGHYPLTEAPVKVLEHYLSFRKG